MNFLYVLYVCIDILYSNNVEVKYCFFWVTLFKKKLFCYISMKLFLFQNTVLIISNKMKNLRANSRNKYESWYKNMDWDYLLGYKRLLKLDEEKEQKIEYINKYINTFLNYYKRK